MMLNDPSIDIRLLQCLMVLVAECSVTRAAERLGMSQPAMSHSLAKMRQIFGDPILTRGRNGLTATARAIELDLIAREILQDVVRMTAASPSFDPKTSETSFTVTATEYVEHVLIGGLLSVLRAEAPQIRIEFRPPDRSRAMGWLERREVDLRLGWVHEPEPVLRSKPLFEEKLVVIVRSGHPQITGSITLEQYLQSGHVTSEVAGLRTTGRSIDEALGSLGRKLEKRVQIQSALTIPNVVANSNLIATIPQRLATTFAKDLGLQMIEPPMKLPSFRCAAYWHDAVHRDPRHKWFRDVMIRTARQLAR